MLIFCSRVTHWEASVDIDTLYLLLEVFTRHAAGPRVWTVVVFLRQENCRCFAEGQPLLYSKDSEHGLTEHGLTRLSFFFCGVGATSVFLVALPSVGQQSFSA